MATIISFPTRTRGDQLSRSQLDAVRVGLELLGADHAHRLPILSAAIANRTIPHEPGHVCVGCFVLCVMLAIPIIGSSRNYFRVQEKKT